MPFLDFEFLEELWRGPQGAEELLNLFLGESVSEKRFRTSGNEELDGEFLIDYIMNQFW